ncbi:hypothetical protein BCV72DRAFT_15188 [Rhizopus microsporus var. microsporus]|uniref:Uncharacterized protein n=2 Tax=Rhizopus microsporus TaxID=58291 RepID=A0A2G4SNA9_RHIZD|nr:uncharacterized protein RHIMIDRAFT_35918 [Rhizopus microsporus ATCC 52813]ORE10553.1 hypothetical protein BCV72DRAFT_15188 [Rhizopus microsporus var. microsporus]PHZ10225.1 hypothetical protein RHIMIDRAFT_35918 [Rhizopus microsporus ATCC 52813]
MKVIALHTTQQQRISRIRSHFTQLKIQDKLVQATSNCFRCIIDRKAKVNISKNVRITQACQKKKTEIKQIDQTSARDTLEKHGEITRTIKKRNHQTFSSILLLFLFICKKNFIFIYCILYTLVYCSCK